MGPRHRARAQIVLVEANSPSLSDLMTTVATAAALPGVSVVSMSWGFPEGQSVLAADEAMYDFVFNVPGVTFLASTGDDGAAGAEYPAFSPNVVAVGGTTLNLSAHSAYSSETGWGDVSGSSGTSIGSGGGISLYEPEPSYQQGVQSTGYRTTPDVALVADPNTGAWVADPYNLDPSNPFEVVGGTSLATPAWAGLIALVNQGRAAAGEPALNSTGPNETQQALYVLPQSDYNVMTSGNNGYAALAGYNLVTGLGTPVAGAGTRPHHLQRPGPDLFGPDRRPARRRDARVQRERRERHDERVQRLGRGARAGRCSRARCRDGNHRCHRDVAVRRDRDNHGRHHSTRKGAAIGVGIRGACRTGRSPRHRSCA